MPWPSPVSWALALVVAAQIAKRTPRPRFAVVGSVTAGSVLSVGLGLWVAANDPTVQWFGHIVTHGDRHDQRVALTFDDGPDDPFSLQISHVLDEHGVKGTFFEVGKAIKARPEIVR